LHEICPDLSGDSFQICETVDIVLFIPEVLGYILLSEYLILWGRVDVLEENAILEIFGVLFDNARAIRNDALNYFELEVTDLLCCWNVLEDILYDYLT
jgi:hypothetical protein